MYKNWRKLKEKEKEKKISMDSMNNDTEEGRGLCGFIWMWGETRKRK